MGDVLGRKQRIKNDDWIQALAKIEKLVQKKELDRLAEKTVKRSERKPEERKLLMRGAAARIPWYLVNCADRPV